MSSAKFHRLTFTTILGCATFLFEFSGCSSRSPQSETPVANSPVANSPVANSTGGESPTAALYDRGLQLTKRGSYAEALAAFERVLNDE
ncbi:MAG: TolA-binding protein, partial [Pirellulaceae bacterium]